MAASSVLTLIIISGVVCAVRRENDAASENVACGEPAVNDTIYVGVHVATDDSFRACSPYKQDILEDYLSAFVGAMNMRFLELRSPAVQIVFLGSSELTDEQERIVIGKNKDASEMTVRGGDALLEIMDITTEEGYSGLNKVFLVLTWLNITDEMTQNTANDKVPTPKDSAVDYSSSSEDSVEIGARSSSNENTHKNVFGLAQYGSLCSPPGAGAIVQDDGKYFSGVDVAAIQVATALGPMYNGSIARRVCREHEYGSQFHMDECYAISTKNVGDLDCLGEDVEYAGRSVKTPRDFFTKYKEWTPCGVSYMGSHKCQDSAGEECQIKCCFNQDASNLNAITAPDGTNCSSGQMCIDGKCKIKAKAATRR